MTRQWEHLQEDCKDGIVALQLGILDHQGEGPWGSQVQADALQAGDASALALSTVGPHCTWRCPMLSRPSPALSVFKDASYVGLSTSILQDRPVRGLQGWHALHKKGI